MKFQLESYVVVGLRISPLINKMSVQSVLFCRALHAFPILLSRTESKSKECEMHKNPDLFMRAMIILSAKTLLSHRAEKLKSMRLLTLEIQQWDLSVLLLDCLITSLSMGSDFYED